MLFCFFLGNSLCFPSTNHLSSSCWTLTYLSKPRSNVTSQWCFPTFTPQSATATLGGELCLLHMYVVHSFTVCVKFICAHIYLPTRTWAPWGRHFLKSILTQKLIQINENSILQRGNWGKSCKFWVRSCLYLKFRSWWIFYINVDFILNIALKYYLPWLLSLLMFL